MNSRPDNPSRLETAILGASFLLLWAWFLARQKFYKANLSPPTWFSWSLLLLVAALAWVFVRRVKRVTRAMREQKIGIGKPKR